jgi:hypothetical protein
MKSSQTKEIMTTKVSCKLSDDFLKKLLKLNILTKVLEEQGLLGVIKVAMPRRTVFIEAFAKDEAELASTISSLPLAKLWDLEFFVTTPPAGAPSTD